MSKDNAKNLSFIPSGYGNATRVPPRFAGIPVPYVNGTYGKNFDIVIPVGIHDIVTIAKVVKYAKKNIIGYRNIYLLSCKADLVVEGCITIDESIAIFNKSTIEKKLKEGNIEGGGWYLQQLLKFYASLIIPEMLDDYLVIDADVYFLKPTAFFSKSGKTLLAFADNKQEPHHEPYFRHMSRLHPKLVRLYPQYSGICHHMMFNRGKIAQLMYLVESNHNNQAFWQILLQCVIEESRMHKQVSCMSEYEIYFNYLAIFHPDYCEVRKLEWTNTYYIPNKILELTIFRKFYYVSQFVRGNRIKMLTSKLRDYIPYRKSIKKFLKSVFSSK